MGRKVYLFPELHTTCARTHEVLKKSEAKHRNFGPVHENLRKYETEKRTT